VVAVAQHQRQLRGMVADHLRVVAVHVEGRPISNKGASFII
jgi:hypothetical protein